MSTLIKKSHKTLKEFIRDRAVKASIPIFSLTFEAKKEFNDLALQVLGIAHLSSENNQKWIIPFFYGNPALAAVFKKFLWHNSLLQPLQMKHIVERTKDLEGKLIEHTDRIIFSSALSEIHFFRLPSSISNKELNIALAGLREKSVAGYFISDVYFSQYDILTSEQISELKSFNQ